MFYDSNEWKNELNKVFKRLKKNMNKKYSYRRNFLIEKDLLISALIIRKLIESDKMSDYIDSYMIQVEYYKPIKHIDKLHNYIEENYYDWDKKQNKNLLLRDICNYLIHSYVFNTVYNDNRKLEYFLVSSDYNRNEFLYQISITSWIGIIKEVVEDQIVMSSKYYEENIGDYKSVIKQRGIL